MKLGAYAVAGLDGCVYLIIILRVDFKKRPHGIVKQGPLRSFNYLEEEEVGGEGRE